MSVSELLETYKKQICISCNNKDGKDCNIKVYQDHKNKSLCCKCVYFNSDKETNNEIKSI